MREKYIKFFKKELVFLLILLVVVCFSFGVTYSNFIYNSDEFRAVEMFTNKLEYELNSNTFNIKPGNNLIKLSIKSLNNVDSYYKIVCNEKINIKLFNSDNKIIKSNETINESLVAYNNTNKELTIHIDVVGGFITNSYEDVKSYGREITNSIFVGDVLTYNNNKYKLLNINNDGSYELLSDYDLNNIELTGSSDYNRFIDIINENLEDSGSRVINIEDLEKYTKNNLTDYNTTNYFSDVYYPSLWAFEKGSIINNQEVKNGYSKSEGVKSGSTNNAESITVKNIELKNIEFIDEKYNELFLSDDYLLGTRYNLANGDNAQWGILSIHDGKLKTNRLFESDGEEFTLNIKPRIIVNIPSNIDLFSQEI